MPKRRQHVARPGKSGVLTTLKIGDFNCEPVDADWAGSWRISRSGAQFLYLEEKASRFYVAPDGPAALGRGRAAGHSRSVDP